MTATTGRARPDPAPEARTTPEPPRCGAWNSSTMPPAPARSISAATPSTRPRSPGMSRTSSAWRKCRSGSPARCWSTASTHAGEFYVPLATTEGTLVASYNRGMKLLHRAGGVKTTVMDDRMQRAPAFGFDSAREARAFGQWVTANFDAIKARGRCDHPHRPPARYRAVLGQQVHLPPVQLHDRRRRRPEHDGQGNVTGVRLDPRTTTPGYASSASSPTWPRTRRARRSTSSPPGASGSPRRRRSRPD